MMTVNEGWYIPADVLEQDEVNWVEAVNLAAHADVPDPTLLRGLDLCVGCVMLLSNGEIYQSKLTMAHRNTLLDVDGFFASLIYPLPRLKGESLIAQFRESKFFSNWLPYFLSPMEIAKSICDREASFDLRQKQLAELVTAEVIDLRCEGERTYRLEPDAVVTQPALRRFLEKCGTLDWWMSKNNAWRDSVLPAVFENQIVPARPEPPKYSPLLHPTRRFAEALLRKVRLRGTVDMHGRPLFPVAAPSLASGNGHSSAMLDSSSSVRPPVDAYLGLPGLYAGNWPATSVDKPHPIHSQAAVHSANERLAEPAPIGPMPEEIRVADPPLLHAAAPATPPSQHLGCHLNEDSIDQNPVEQPTLRRAGTGTQSTCEDVEKPSDVRIEDVLAQSGPSPEDGQSHTADASDGRSTEPNTNHPNGEITDVSARGGAPGQTGSVQASATTQVVAAGDEIAVGDRFMSLDEVEKISGIGKSTIYAQMRAGLFPQCIKVSAKASRWSYTDVQNWLQDKKDGHQRQWP